MAKGVYWLAGPKPEQTPDIAKSEERNGSADVDVSDAGVAPIDASNTELAKAIEPNVHADAAPSVPTDREYTPADIFKNWSPSVVTIAAHRSSMAMSGGTGFIINREGVIVTNHHVIENSESVSVKLLDGSWASKVELLMQDEDRDVAVLKIETNATLHPVSLGDSKSIVVGERAISIGNPLGLEHTLTDGVVSARRTLKGKKMIQM